MGNSQGSLESDSRDCRVVLNFFHANHFEMFKTFAAKSLLKY
jgi:hypothetical protein